MSSLLLDEQIASEQEKARRRQRGLRDQLILTGLAIVIALVVGALLMIFSDDQCRSDLGYFFQHPADFFSDAWYTVRDGYQAMFEGAIFDPDNDGSVSGIFGPLTNSVYTATPLILAGLGISIAFRTGMFNIGGQGQVIAGAMASGYVGFAWSLPPFLHLILAVAAGIIAGGLWGFIAGYLKARTGAHEVITTIMLNWIAVYVLKYLLTTKDVISGPGGQASKTIHGSARLPHIFGNSLQVNLGFLLAIAGAVFMWWLLTRSTIGFRLRAVGANPAAARTAGMSVSAMTVLALALAGAFAGLGGTALSLGGATSYQVTPSIDSNVGFDAITVALLGRNSPMGTVFAGLLFGALRQGGAQMQAAVQIPVDLVTVVQALIVIFVAAPRLTRAIFRMKSAGLAGLNAAATNLVVSVNTTRKTRVQRHIVIGVLGVVLALLSLRAFALGSRSKGRSIFQFYLPDAKYHIGQWGFTARPAVIILCVITVVVAALCLAKIVSSNISIGVTVVALVLSFIIWSVAGTPNGLNVVSLLQGTLFPAAIPLIFGALAGIIGERSGVVNVAIEGQLLMGAFAAALIGTIAGSVWVGIIGGALAGVLIAAILAVMAIRYLVDQVIIGVVLNLFVLGLTSFLFTKMLSPHASQFNQPGYLKDLKIPVLGDIPIIGPVLFDGTLFLYAAYVLVAAVSYGLFRTRWGLRVRAVGEHPKAADTVGINVLRTRYRAVWIAGAIAGLGGAFYVLGTGNPGTFSLNMTSGKGYIALACVIFGKWSPKGAVTAALLFGFFDQLQSLLQGGPVDSNLLLTLPYVVTVIAVAGFIGRVRAPAADGQPYTSR